MTKPRFSTFHQQRVRDELLETNTYTEETYGTRCTFEKECSWKWDTGENYTFQVATIKNLTDAKAIGLVPGPNHDQKFVVNHGHFLHLRLSPTSPVHTIASPIFSSTKEGCHLDMFAHQSGNRNGKFRIVIEPVNKSAWVPTERSGNDLRRWTELMFPIGRVSQEFRILLEVVPKGLRSQQRAYISIDNLRLRGCFEQNNSIAAINGKCAGTDIKCKSNNMDVCVKARQHCDINIDCDDREDEMKSCGKCGCRLVLVWKWNFSVLVWGENFRAYITFGYKMMMVNECIDANVLHVLYKT